MLNVQQDCWLSEAVSVGRFSVFEIILVCFLLYAISHESSFVCGLQMKSV